MRHTHRSLLAEAADFVAQLGGRDGSTLMQTFPIAHIGGDVCLILSVAEGVPTVFPEAWHGARAAAAVEHHGVTGTGSTPFFVETLLRAHDGGADLSSLPRVMTGGAAVDPALIEAADGRGLHVFRSYGSTEHPTVTGTPEGEALVHRARTDGRPSGDSEVLVVDAGGQPVATGERGEVLVRGSEQFAGYRDAGAEAGAGGPGPLVDGWFRTGDLGRVDGDGRLVITGRITQIIIRGGENISVAEVEDALRSHPAVHDCAVVAVAAPRYGERAAAVVVTEGAPLTLAHVRDHFAALGVARFKVPEFVLRVDELPHNAVGKVDRARVSALVEALDPFPAGS